MRKIVRAAFALLLLIMELAPRHALALLMDGCPALGNETAQVMVDVDSTFARNQPTYSAAVLTRLIKFQCFFAIGRNQAGDFILVRDGTSKLWISVQDIRTRGSVDKLPVTADIVGSSAVTLGRDVPGLPSISGRARELYASAASRGRDLGMVTVTGDCNSEAPVFFGRIASGAFNPAPYGLGNAAYRFSKSWSRWSLATSGSFNTGSALDASWSNPQKCNSNETPLACELRESRASVLLISLGTGDQFSWQQFSGRLSQIVNETIATGVLPVLMTKADALESQQGGAPADSINNAIRGVGAQYSVPVIDLAVAAKNLPNNGLANEPPPQFHLSAEGETLKMIMTLVTLEQLASGVPYSPPAAAPPAPVAPTLAPAPTSAPPPPPTPTPAPPPTSAVQATPAPRPTAVATSVIVQNAPTAMPTAGPVTNAPTAVPTTGPVTAVAIANGKLFRVSAANINLRNGPSTGAGVIATGRGGQEFAVLESSGDWLRLKVGNGEAWALGNLGTLIQPASALTTKEQPYSAYALVTQSRAVLRDAPYFDAAQQDWVFAGLALPIMGGSGADWLSVQTSTMSRTLWVHRNQIAIVGELMLR